MSRAENSTPDSGRGILSPKTSNGVNTYHGTTWSYIAGFAASLALTFGAYAAVTSHLAFGVTLATLVVGLALVQLVVQIIFFLHLGRRAPLWNRAAFAFALIIVIILVAGSLWIMQNLNGRMMPSAGEMEQYMQDESGI